MPSELERLRKQVAIYLQDAHATDDEQVATRLIMLAVWCQERILELEHAHLAHSAAG